MTPTNKDITRFWSKVDKTQGCWNWTGERSKAGYGRIKVQRKRWLAHRLAYTLNVSEIPLNMTIDHMCNNTSCVNPNHLAVVTLGDNVRRSKNWLKANKASGEVQKAKTSCPNGHAYDLSNTYICKKNKRHCMECRRTACRKNYWKDKNNA